MSIEPKLVWTSDECARQLSVSTRQLNRMSTPNGTLPVLRLGKRLLRYDRRTVEKWLEEQAASVAAEK